MKQKEIEDALNRGVENGKQVMQEDATVNNVYQRKFLMMISNNSLIIFLEPRCKL